MNGSRPRQGGGVRGEHFAEHSPDHLPRGHAAATGNGFQFQRLPEGQQEGKLNDFLVPPVRIGSDRIE
jgi:hypothetical protein